MKYFLILRYFYFFTLSFLIFNTNSFAQCAAGYSRDTLNWNYRDFLPTTGTNYTTYISAAKSQTQYFTFGVQRVRITHNFSGTNAPGDDGTHTGSTGSYGIGDDVHFLGNGTITLTFDSPVMASKFSIYDIDRYQTVTITAVNGVVPVAVNMARVSGSILTISNLGLSSTATASSARASNTSSDGTANVNIASLVTSITITITNTGTRSDEDGSFWLSDIIACSAGTFPTNYYAVSRPFTNQPGYILVALDNTVYYVDIATGNAKFLFTDPGTTNINSMAYDPYRHMIYYTYSLTATPTTDRTVRRYDYEQDTLGILTTNVNNLGIPTYDAGVESGAAAFYNGSLYLGIEGYASSGANSNRETAIWKMDFDASYAPNGNYAQVFAVPGDNGAGTLLHDWSDFGINDGILYDFDGASSNRDFYHMNLQNGGTVNFAPSPGSLVPRQASVDWTGVVYNVGSPSASASGTIVPYNLNGTVNTAMERDITFNGSAISGSWGDAAEAFKPKTDFGDAPASYDPGGGDPATHEIIPTLRIGNNVDIEFTKKTSASASGDNYDDGIPTIQVMPPGVSSYACSVNVFNNTGANATLIGWIDMNGDGVFQASEGRTAVVTSSPSPQSVIIYWSFMNITLPVSSTTFMRLRITSASYGMSTSTPNGFYENGEVEDYLVNIENVLPVEEISMQAKKVDKNTAAISWNVLDETNFAGYELQRSADGIAWQTIYSTRVNPANAFSYKQLDNTPVVPNSYYRIKVLKNSGNILYTAIKRLNFGGDISMLISPNPAKTTATLMVQSSVTDNAALTFIDYSGRVIYKQTVAIVKGENKIYLPIIEKLSSGLYRVRLILNNQVLSTSLMVRQ